MLITVLLVTHKSTLSILRSLLHAKLLETKFHNSQTRLLQGNYFSGCRTRRFSNFNTKTGHWIWFQASSIHLLSSEHISVTSILMLSSQILIGLQSGRSSSIFFIYFMTLPSVLYVQPIGTFFNFSIIRTLGEVARYVRNILTPRFISLASK